MTLPRDVVDEILRRAADGSRAYLHERPYEVAGGLVVEVWYRQAVYAVTVDSDGRTAQVRSYWGNVQLSVTDAEATPEQIDRLCVRWKLGHHA